MKRIEYLVWKGLSTWYEKDWALNLYRTTDGFPNVQFTRGICGCVQEVAHMSSQMPAFAPQTESVTWPLGLYRILYTLQPRPWTRNPFQNVVLLHAVFLLPSLPVNTSQSFKIQQIFVEWMHEMVCRGEGLPWIDHSYLWVPTHLSSASCLALTQFLDLFTCSLSWVCNFLQHRDRAFCALASLVPGIVPGT